MNLNRVIIGPLISIVFLLLFVYMVAGAQLVYDNFLTNNSQGLAQINSDIFLGSVLNTSQDFYSAGLQLSPDSIYIKDLEAKSAISVETNLIDQNRIVVYKNIEAPLPIASLTKLMTAIVVLDNYNSSDIVTVNKSADSQTPVKQDVKMGDTMPVQSFLQIMLVGSSNKAAYALAEKIGTESFVKLMNQKSKDLYLENTFFADPTGLSQFNVSTASDLTKLAEHILKNYPAILKISRAKQLYVQGFGDVVNTDDLLGEVPDVVCSKTGFTKEAKGCLLLITANPEKGNYLINVVLGAEDRFGEMKQIIDLASNNTICQ